MPPYSVISQPSFDVVDRDVLFGEGIIDPEVGVLCVRDLNRRIIGVLVNFACHAVHLMGRLSAGFPGVLRDRLKEHSPVAKTFVVSLANGWLGYIPHREAFDRIGGHESTWCISSKMEPGAGDRMADAVLELIGRT